MYVWKYIPERLYGFLKDENGQEFFFHLAGFAPVNPPPIHGEHVIVDMADVILSPDKAKAPKVLKVTRTTTPVLQTGVVSFFDPRKGFGFIKTQTSQHYMHKSEIINNKMPVVGQVVTFYEGNLDGKSRACYINILS